MIYGGVTLALALASSQALAVSANPRLQNFTQPDGTRFTGKLQGDEWFHWYRTTDGRVFVRNPETKAFEFARLEINNGERTLVSTGVRVGSGAATISSASTIQDSELFQIAANAQVRAGIKRDGVHEHQTAKTGAARFSTTAMAAQTYPTLVIMVEFTDTQITSPLSTWSQKIFGTNFGQLKHFYNEISYGKVNVVPAAETEGNANDGFVRVRLNYPHPHPNGDPDRERALLRDALVLADAKVNFSTFDTNGDGRTSAKELQVGFLVAGPEWAYGNDGKGLWAHSSFFSDAPVLDGVRVASHTNYYFSWGERHGDHDATVGVIAHEFGHSAFSLPDLYPNLGIWDLMASGSWSRKTDDIHDGQTPVQMTAHTKWKAGFIDPTHVDPMYASTTRTLHKSLSSTPSLLITEVPKNVNAYFALEHRRVEGYDLGLTGYGVEAGRSGILVISETGARESLGLVIADGSTPTNQMFFPGNKDRLASDTTPNTNDRYGDTTGITFENIAYSGDAMTVKISRAATAPGAACRLFTSANSAHVTAGRAYTVVTGTWFKTTTYYAVGSQQSLGTVATTQTTLKEDPAGHFAKGACPAQNPPSFSEVQITTDGRRASIQGYVSDAENDLALVEVDIDASGIWQRVGRYYVESDQRWSFNSFTTGLAQGSHTYRLRATDAGNRTTLFGPFQFTSEGPRAPACTIDRVHRDSQGYYTAWGQVSDLDGDYRPVEVSLDNGIWRASVSDWQGWMVVLSQQPNDLANGVHTVSARVADDTGLAGACGPFEFEVGVEHLPTATITEARAVADVMSLNGKAEDIDGDLTGVETELDGNGQWQLATSFHLANPAEGFWYTDLAGISIGSHTVRARGVDAGGRRGSPTAAISFQVFPPQAPVCTIDAVVLENGYYMATGTHTDVNNDMQMVESYLVDFGDWVAQFSGGDNMLVLVTQGTLPSGNYTAQVRVHDSRGEHGTCSKVFSVGAAPTLNSFTVNASGMSVTSSGTAADADNDLVRVELQYDDEFGPWVSASGTTSWTHTNNSLAAGTHKVRARAVDAGGRTSAPSAWTSFSLSSVSCFTAVNTAHASAGRATLKYVTLYYANGSNTYLGTGTATTSLKQQGANNWAKVTSCP
ncbi:MAG: M6 family metalloprotease domain-containing protein [Myxococcaceae bacterium]